MWRWYIVILCSKDLYTLYEDALIMHARSTKEACDKAIEGKSVYIFTQTVFGPFANKPKQH